MIFKKQEKKDESVDDLIISDLGVNKDTASRKRSEFKFKKINIRIVAVIVLVVLVLATLIFVLKFVSFNSATLIWKTSLTRGSENVNNKSIEYASFKN